MWSDTQRLAVAKTALLVGTAVTAMGVGGCAAAPRLSWARVGESAMAAVASPLVWVPTAGALTLQIDDWDREVSDWAADHNPLFGSEDNAQDASDALRSTAQLTLVVAALVTPTGENYTYDRERKVWDVGVGAGAVFATRSATGGIKKWTGRTRPDASSDRSFPSGHASHAAVTSTLALRYVDYVPTPVWVDTLARGTLVTLPYATGWARVEARRHFPADVLAGIALGNFFGVFANELLELDGNTGISFAPANGGGSLGFTTRF